jgi:FixJ family two-component response regulator
VSVPPLIGIVDDEEDFRRAVARLLRAHEFEIEGFGSGAEFLSQAEKHAFDCVLLDLLMPGMSGLDVLAALYGNPDAPPAIVISGQDDPDLFERAKALNAFECHSKPIGQDTLLGAIGRALQLRHS